MNAVAAIDSATLDGKTLRRAAGAFAGFSPWRGEVPSGRVRNFLGALLPTGVGVDPAAPARFQEAGLPTLRWGEGFFEFYSALQSVRAARERYTAISLGAHYGGPLVNAALFARRLRPELAVKLIAVEGDPHMCAMIRAHFIDNGFDPADHAIVNAVVSGDNKPVLFTTSPVRTGANVAFHSAIHRKTILDGIVKNKFEARVATGLVLAGTTTLTTPLDGTEVAGEIEFMSAITVADAVGPHDVVDFLEIDIQSSEYVALPPAIGLLDRKVRWVHLGTHGGDLHVTMRHLFRDHGWEVHADLLPERDYDTPDGPARTQDGVLSLRNPRLG
jgi:hypothetical protein